jgi:hypothetical protein
MKGYLYKVNTSWVMEYFHEEDTPEGTVMNWKTTAVMPEFSHVLDSTFDPNGNKDVEFTEVTVKTELSTQRYAFIDLTTITQKVKLSPLDWKEVWGKWEEDRGFFDGFWELKNWLKKNFLLYKI